MRINVKSLSSVVLAIFVLVLALSSALVALAEPETCNVNITLNIFEAFPGQAKEQAKIEEYEITVTIILPDGGNGPTSYPGTETKMENGSYQYIFKLKEFPYNTETFIGLPFGTHFTIEEDPAEYSFAMSYQVDGLYTNSFKVSGDHDVEINNDFKIAPCDYGLFRLEKAVNGNIPLPENTEYTFEITFINKSEETQGSNRGPETVVFEVTIKDGEKNAYVLPFVPKDTEIKVKEKEISYGNPSFSSASYTLTTTYTLNGANYNPDSEYGKIESIAELRFICTNNYTSTTTPDGNIPDGNTPPDDGGSTTIPLNPPPGDEPGGGDPPTEEEGDVPPPDIPLDPPPPTVDEDDIPEEIPLDPPPGLPFTGGTNGFGIVGLAGLALVVTGLLLGKKARR